MTLLEAGDGLKQAFNSMFKQAKAARDRNNLMLTDRELYLGLLNEFELQCHHPVTFHLAGSSRSCGVCGAIISTLKGQRGA